MVSSVVFSVLLICSDANNILVIGNVRVGQKSKFTWLIISDLKTDIGCDFMKGICRRAIIFIFKCRNKFFNGHKFRDDGEVETVELRWLVTQETEFCHHGMVGCYHHMINVPVVMGLIQNLEEQCN